MKPAQEAKIKPSIGVVQGNSPTRQTISQQAVPISTAESWMPNGYIRVSKITCIRNTS